MVVQFAVAQRERQNSIRMAEQVLSLSLLLTC